MPFCEIFQVYKHLFVRYFPPHLVSGSVPHKGYLKVSTGLHPLPQILTFDDRKVTNKLLHTTVCDHWSLVPGPAAAATLTEEAAKINAIMMQSSHSVMRG